MTKNVTIRKGSSQKWDFAALEYPISHNFSAKYNKQHVFSKNYQMADV